MQAGPSAGFEIPIKPSKPVLTRAKWAAIEKALGQAKKTRTVLAYPSSQDGLIQDLTRNGFKVLGFDRARVPVPEASSTKEFLAQNKKLVGLLRAKPKQLPLRTRSVDCILCVGFMPRVRRSKRVRALVEMRRVSKRWVLVDYRHQHNLGFKLNRLQETLGFAPPPIRNALTRREMDEEFRNAGLAVRKVFPVGGALSDEWVVLAEAPHSSSIR